MKVIYFSATGNSLYVAKHLSSNLYAIPQLLKQKIPIIQDAHAIGIILPVYAQIIDPYFEQFLLTVELQTPYLFAILTHGKAMGMAGEHLQAILKRRGMHLSYLNSIEMVDNYLPMFNMQEQIHQESQDSIHTQIMAIKHDVTHHKHYIKPSPAPFTATQDQTKRAICQQFTVEEHCTGCAVCQKVCPLGNIHIAHHYPQFSSNCIDCLACTHNCPVNAIRLEGEQSKDRYRKAEITLNEIIMGNMQ